MNTGFKHRIVEHLQQRELDDAQWQQLRSLQQRANGSRSRRRPALVALAASLLLALLVGLTLDWTDQDLSRQIADEVAMNHLKQRPLEVVGSTLDDLRPYFDELEFQLLEPSNWQASSFGLAGGRYCSVRGSPRRNCACTTMTVGRTRSIRSPMIAPGSARSPTSARVNLHSQCRCAG